MLLAIDNYVVHAISMYYAVKPLSCVCVCYNNSTHAVIITEC